jgi:hypothetical protein
MAGRPSFRGRVGVEDEKHGEQTRAGRADGERSVPNTVPMPVTARGHAAPGEYGNTGHTIDRNGSLGNTLQDSYNEHAGHGRKNGGKKGEIMGQEKSSFYNDLGKGGDGDGEDESGSGTGKARSIRGFGAGKNTFGEKSNFYNDLGEEHETDAECNSGSGVFKQGPGGVAKKIRGFTAVDGEKSGFI